MLRKCIRFCTNSTIVSLRKSFHQLVTLRLVLEYKHDSTMAGCPFQILASGTLVVLFSLLTIFSLMQELLLGLNDMLEEAQYV